MIIAVTLFGYAAVMATAGAWLLREAAWPVRAPQLAITAWLAVAISVLTSILLGAVALSVRIHLVSTDLADLARICAMNLRSAYEAPATAVTTTLAIAIATFVSARFAWGVTTTIRRAAQHRRRQLQILNLIARRDPELDVRVFDHVTPTVFCLAGRDQAVVVTSTALAVLSPRQLAAVLEHERAHLRGRHHLLVGLADGLVRAFPRVPLFTWTRQQVRRLVELAADDQACRNHPRSCIASAILLLADGTPPAAALAMGGDATRIRIQRLSAKRIPLRWGTLATLHGLVAAVLLAPAAMTTLAALITAGLDDCGPI